jgi:hypothetical protein
VLYLRLIILSVEGDIFFNSDAPLVTDFINLKIKLTQSFRCAYRDKVCMHVFNKGQPRERALPLNVGNLIIYFNKGLGFLQDLHTYNLQKILACHLVRLIRYGNSS